MGRLTATSTVYSFLPARTFTTGYGYDAASKRTGFTDPEAGATAYVYDTLNRLQTLTPPTAYGVGSFAFVNDELSRRKQLTRPNNVTSNYDYKPNTSWLASVLHQVGATTATSNYLYDGDNLIEEVDALGAVMTRYAQGLNIDEPLAMLQAGVTSYYHADGLGSVASLTDATGAVANTYSYDSFGNTTPTGPLTKPLQYTGRELDAETGLYFYRARYYDPAIGRFISEDPIRTDERIGFYTYVGNNPTNFTDPLGLYETHPDVPKPLPSRLHTFMKCMDICTGKPQYVRATSNEDHVDPGHAAGTSVDLRPVGTRSDKVFCCAGHCGAVFVLDERKIKTKKGQGLYYHIQLERSIVPKGPNSIPDRPECKPNGCEVTQ
jgi:RHS repeat-associated protein